MRLVVSFVIFFGLLIWFLVFRPKDASNFAEFIGESATTALYEREIKIHGGSEQSQRDAFLRLKKAGDNFSIRFFPQEAKAKVLAIPSVASVQIESCSFFSISCFDVTLEEREPVFFVPDVKNKKGSFGGWLVSSEGAFIRRAIPQDINASLVQVFGLGAVSGESTEITKILLSKAYKIVSLLQTNLSATVSVVRFLKSGELELKLSSPCDWEVLFTLPDNDQVAVAEVKHLYLALKEFKGRESLVKRVELSFDKMAVVVLKDGVKISAK